MYRVNVISPGGLIVKSCLLMEPPDEAMTKTLLKGMEGYWVDVCREEINLDSDEYDWLREKV